MAKLVRQMIDLEIQAYMSGKHSNFQAITPTEHRKLFTRPRIKTYSHRGLDPLIKELRHSTWKRHEHHENQLRHFIDQDRFQYHTTRQAEYDKLRSDTSTPVSLQPFVNSRLEVLKTFLLNK